jgi:hypothetical protein
LVKIFLVAFADKSLAQTSERFRREAESLSVYDEILIFNEDDIPSSDWPAGFKKSQRGFGYWFWKPYLIRKVLERVGVGDIVHYVDIGCKLRDNAKEYIEEIKSLLALNAAASVLAYSISNGNEQKWYSLIEEDWTKNEVFEALGVENNAYVRNSEQIATTSIFFKRTPEALKLINEWEMLGRNLTLVDDSKTKAREINPFFKENRHDQSLFSVLIKVKYNEIVVLRDLFELGNADPLSGDLKDQRRIKIASSGESLSGVVACRDKKFNLKKFLKVKVVNFVRKIKNRDLFNYDPISIFLKETTLILFSKFRSLILRIKNNSVLKDKDLVREFSELRKNRKCNRIHIVGSGESVLETIEKVAPNDTIVTMNFGGLVCPSVDFYFIEFASERFEDVMTKQCNILKKIKNNSSGRANRIIVKNLWSKENNLKSLQSIAKNLDAGVLEDFHVKSQSYEDLYNEFNGYLSSNDTIAPQCSSTVVYLVLLAVKSGFMDIVLHGIDLGGPYFYNSACYEPPELFEDDLSSVIPFEQTASGLYGLNQSNLFENQARKCSHDFKRLLRLLSHLTSNVDVNLKMADESLVSSYWLPYRSTKP